MGIPVRQVKMACFVLCSMLAGFAGTIQVFRLQSPLPSIGESLELQAVAAAVIGGVALTGGVGTVFGAIIGALLIRVIDNGLVLSRIDANWFKFAIGALTVLAVVGNSWLQRTARQIKVEVVSVAAPIVAFDEHPQMVLGRPRAEGRRPGDRAPARWWVCSATTAPASRR